MICILIILLTKVLPTFNEGINGAKKTARDFLDSKALDLLIWMKSLSQYPLPALFHGQRLAKLLLDLQDSQIKTVQEKAR